MGEVVEAHPGALELPDRAAMGQAGEVVGAGRLAAADLLQGLESLSCVHDCRHKAPDLDE